MGRTLHFEARREDGGRLTEREKTAMFEISVQYNSGKFANIWSCENFFLDAYQYYPNWDKYGRTDAAAIRNAVDAMEKKLTVELGSRTAAIKQMAKTKDVILFDQESTNVHGFCKVQGNELNAFFVYQALLDISRRCPKLVIDLYDEGHYLLCDVRLMGGKAQPRLSKLLEHINNQCKRALLASPENSEFSALKEIVVPSGLCEELVKDCGIGNPYGKEHSIQYINAALRDLKLVQDAIRRHCDYPLFVYNIEQHFFEPSLFVRKLTPEDFKDYKRSIKTLLGGFGGEYWSLNDYDAEGESYKAAAFGQKLAKAGGGSIEILGVEKKDEAA